VEFPLSPSHATFVWRLVLVLIVYFIPMLISAFGLVSRKQWSIYLFRFVLPLGVVGLLAPMVGFVPPLMDYPETAQRLHDLGGLCIVLCICSLFGGIFAYAVAERRELKIRLGGSPKMNRLALVPLCPSHNERMKVNAVLRGYSCPLEGCRVSYTVEDGYIRVVNGVKQKPTYIKLYSECAARRHVYRSDGKETGKEAASENENYGRNHSVQQWQDFGSRPDNDGVPRTSG
jgi:hypothetical protein